MELGFPREESTLALRIAKNDLEEAVTLLTENDLEGLQALAQVSAKKEQQKSKNTGASLFDSINSFFKVCDDKKIPNLFSFEDYATKMTIVVRTDPKVKAYTQGEGSCAALVAQATILAYQNAS